MNIGNVLAWLMCLALAFFACIIGVRNAGNVLKFERELDHMKMRSDISDYMLRSLFATQVQRMDKSLARVQEELKSLRESGGEEADVARKLEELEKEVGKARELIAPMLEEPPADAPEQ